MPPRFPTDVVPRGEFSELSEARKDFGFETTPAGRGDLKTVTDLRNSAYSFVPGKLVEHHPGRYQMIQNQWES